MFNLFLFFSQESQLIMAKYLLFSEKKELFKYSSRLMINSFPSMEFPENLKNHLFFSIFAIFFDIFDIFTISSILFIIKINISFHSYSITYLLSDNIQYYY